jgi:hypothetical protein
VRKEERNDKKVFKQGPCPGGSLDHIAGGRRQRVTVPGLFLQSSMVQTNINSIYVMTANKLTTIIAQIKTKVRSRYIKKAT